MREGTKRRVRIFLWVILAGTLIGISYGTLTGFAGLGTPAMGGLIGAVHGLRSGGDSPSEGRAFGALRYRDFRFFWVGAIISQVGTWMQQIAQGWLLYDLTGSAFAVGLDD